MITHNLFPTAASFFALGRDLTEQESAFLCGQEQKPNSGNTTSAARTLLDDPILADLRSFIDASVSEYFQTIYSPKHDVKLRITQSWTNYTKPGQYHHKHAHPNSLISGVFYVKSNKDTDRIFFFNDGYEQIKLSVKDWNIYNSESWWLPVGTGDLVIFPSSFTHMVQSVEGDAERVSLAFNTFPVGYVGDEDNLTGLHLKD